MLYDIAIIGAGIVGSCLAHDLSKIKGLQVLVLERESDVAEEATMANSAIIHPGQDPEENTLKALLNVRGSRMYPKLCEELQIEYCPCGAFVCACNDQEEEVLKVLGERAKKREIPYAFLSGEEGRKKEPHLSDSVQQVLSLPTGAVVTPWEVAIALMEEAVLNQVELKLNTEVVGLHGTEGAFQIETTQGNYEAKVIINAGGISSGKITGLLSKKENFSILPRKGEYKVLDHEAIPLTNHILYPVPTNLGKGVLAVPTVHGNVLLGPNSLPVEEETENNTTADAQNYIREQLKKLVKDVPFGKVIREFAGLRATPLMDGKQSGDFIIKEAEDVPGFILAAGIESPGLSSAPAISEYILEHFLTSRFALKEKKETYLRRTPIKKVKDLSWDQRKLLIQEHPSYGRIVCRCEQISEGEVLEAIHRPIGARTIKGIKKRVRPGMGRCQGGFCEPLIVKLLAREWGVDPLEITLDGPGSSIFYEKLKGDIL